MRYWIWWNDLTQGPFELDELVTLRAFSEELLVCMEDRSDWIPAGRVADMSSAIEQLRSRRAAPLTPPPPPPKRPPSVTPLQGEFFGEPQGQQPLLESEDGPRGPFAYRPVLIESDPSAPYFAGQATMPFHFARAPQLSASPAVLEMPRPPNARIAIVTPPVVKESPIPKPLPVEERVRVPLRLLREEFPADLPESIPVSVAEIQPSMAPSFEEPYVAERKLEWLPWVSGVLVSLAVLVGLGYWLMDRASTRSAIVEAQRLEPPAPMAAPAPIPIPTPPLVASPPPVPEPVVQPPSTAAAPRLSTEQPRSLKRQTLTRMKTIAAKPTAAGKMMRTILRLFGIVEPERLTALGVAENPNPTDSVLSAVPAVQSHNPTASPRRAVSRRSLRPARITAKIKSTGAQAIRALKKAQSRAKTVAQKTVDFTTPSIPQKGDPIPPPKEDLVSIPDVPVPGLLPDIPAQVPAALPSAPSAPPPGKPDAWSGRQDDAIKAVMAKMIPKSKVTIGQQARSMLQGMHEKELLHAAETGERLYLPDKLSWAALREEGPHYRVYLNFFSWQASGDRVQSRSYQFLVDLEKKLVRTEDAGTQQDLFTAGNDLAVKHNPMTIDIDSILGGVDHYNKQKMRAIIVKDIRRNRKDQKGIAANVTAAKEKVARAIVFFRKAYSEKALQNIAKAYNFTELL